MKRSLRAKLLILFLTSILAPIIAMSWMISAYHLDRSRATSEQNIFNILYTVSENIRIYLEDLKRMSLSPTIYPDVMQYYKCLNDSGMDESYASYRVAATYRTLMRRLLTVSRQDIRGVAFIPYNNPDQRVFAIDTRVGNVLTTSGYNYADEPWYTEVMTSEGSPVLSVSGSSLLYYPRIYPSSGIPISEPQGMFSVMRLVWSENYTSIVGVIKVDASSDVIREVFDKIATGPHSGMLLLDHHNDVVYSTKNSLNELANRLDSGELALLSDKFAAYIQPISDTGWRLVYLSSKTDLTEQSRSIFIITGIVAALCLFIAFLIFLFYSERITTPVRSIIETMRRVEQGDMTAQVDISGNMGREFMLISEELNRMIQKLDQHITSEYKAVISQHNAEYLALQTQISPHFFYNTLNGFITLNRLGEKKALEDSILCLTKLFRYTCQSENLSTVEMELAFVEQYLILQKLRFDDRLQYRIQAESSLKSLVIPRLLIQPLVENAVIHGMEPSDKPFLLEIDVQAVELAFGKAALLSIADNGVGFDESVAKSRARVGISSVAERLEYFHKEGVFSLKSRPDSGTLCHILIPLAEGERQP